MILTKRINYRDDPLHFDPETKKCLAHLAYSTDRLTPGEPQGTIYCYSCGKYCSPAEYQAYLARQRKNMQDLLNESVPSTKPSTVPATWS